MFLKNNFTEILEFPFLKPEKNRLARVYFFITKKLGISFVIIILYNNVP